LTLERDAYGKRAWAVDVLAELADTDADGPVRLDVIADRRRSPGRHGRSIPLGADMGSRGPTCSTVGNRTSTQPSCFW
jgi:hypothetical protein